MIEEVITTDDEIRMVVTIEEVITTDVEIHEEVMIKVLALSVLLVLILESTSGG
jgi:hypothetical protein